MDIRERCLNFRNSQNVTLPTNPLMWPTLAEKRKLTFATKYLFSFFFNDEPKKNNKKTINGITGL